MATVCPIAATPQAPPATHHPLEQRLAALTAGTGDRDGVNVNEDADLDLDVDVDVDMDVDAISDAQRIAARRVTWAADFTFRTALDAWWFGQLVEASVAIERCQRDDKRTRCELIRRALRYWHDDRRLAAQRIATNLSRRPGLTVDRLRATPQGCDWLLDCWRRLGGIIESRGNWNEDQTKMVFDLLGTTSTLRVASPCAEGQTPRDLVSDQLRALEDRRDALLDDNDVHEQVLAIQGVELEAHPTLARLRREETAARRTFRQAHNNLLARGCVARVNAASVDAWSATWEDVHNPSDEGRNAHFASPEDDPDTLRDARHNIDPAPPADAAIDPGPAPDPACDIAAPAEPEVETIPDPVASPRLAPVPPIATASEPHRNRRQRRAAQKLARQRARSG